MSYYFKDNNNLKKLTKINEYPFINERFLKLQQNKNVIEVGFWVMDLLDNDRPLPRLHIDINQ